MRRLTRRLAQVAIVSSVFLLVPTAPTLSVSAQTAQQLPPGDASAYEASVLAARPVAYWPLTDGLGSTSARDALGLAAGELSGGAKLGEAPGPFPGSTSLRVDGEPCSGVDVSAASGVVTTPNVTIETWIRTDSDREQGIIFRRRFGVTASKRAAVASSSGLTGLAW